MTESKLRWAEELVQVVDLLQSIYGVNDEGKEQLMSLHDLHNLISCYYADLYFVIYHIKRFQEDKQDLV